MTTITLEIPNSEDAEVILLLAKRLNCKIVKDAYENRQKANSKKAISHLKNLAAKGGLKEIISDPVAWQKEIRKDRKLPKRNK
ncbi:MAG: hypothetical protein KDK36_00425 [Leptospiraceae bacterium]|nr:hypothetical protein [Leptospiraceae bacterium]